MRSLLAVFWVGVTLIAAELFLRGLVFIETNDPLRRLAMRIDGNIPVTSEGWAALYFRQVRAGEVPFAKSALFAFHPRRGWTHAPNVSTWIDGYRYTTNGEGHRAQTEPNMTGKRARVLVLGDSQTFGEEVDDAFPWPTVLGKRRPDLDIVNLAVGGYGLDQMIIAYEEEVERWNPDVIVLVAIPDDFYRTVLWFREAPKPIFVEGERGLTLVPPVGGVEATLATLNGRWDVVLRGSVLFATLLEAYEEVVLYPRLVAQSKRLSVALLTRWLADAKRRGIPAVLAYVGELHSADKDPGPFEDEWRQVCRAEASAQLVCPDWRTLAPESAGETRAGHYRRLGHELIATLIAQALERLEFGEAMPARSRS